jgi:sodium transport system permease protein
VRLPIVWTIFRKELRDSLRDRRTLIMMVGLPMLLYPLLILGSAKLVETRRESSEERTSLVALWGEAPAALRDQLVEAEKIDVTGSAGEPEALPRATGEDFEASDEVIEAARSVILEKKVDAVAMVWPGATAALAKERLGHLSVFFDSVRPDSQKARTRLEDVVREYRTEVLKKRVLQRGLPEEFATPVELHAENVATGSRQFGMALGSVLGFILILMSALGGFYAAIDLTAGEKERGTMETLLCAPLRSQEIIAGKFLAVWAISLVASSANVASMGAAFSRIAAGVTEMHMTLGEYLLSLAFLIPISFMLSAVFLAVAVFAKDFKDGQNYLTPVLMVVLAPLIVVALPGVELNAYTAFVPVANIALLIKAVFLAEARPDGIFLTMLASCLYAGLAVLGAAKVFERETVLLGGPASWRDMLRIERKTGETPSATVGLTLFAVVLVVAFYGSLLLVDAGIIPMLLANQFGFFLAPTLAVAALYRYSWRETFSLRPLGWRGVAGSVLIGVSAWAFAAGVLVRLLPPPESLVRAMEKILMLDDQSVPLVVLWLVVAITPAVCEETLFRGLILSGLRSYGMWPAIGVTALLFGLAHASIYRLLPTAFLGLVLGYAVWKTESVFAGIVIHALNNGLMVSLARSKTVVDAFGLEDSTELPWSLTLGGTVLLLAGLLVMRSVGGTEKREDAGREDHSSEL